MLGLGSLYTENTLSYPHSFSEKVRASVKPNPLIKHGCVIKNRIAQTNHREPKHDDIAALAYRIWEKEGRLNGRDSAHWSQAEMQLKATRRAELKKSVVAETKERDLNKFLATRSTT